MIEFCIGYLNNRLGQEMKTLENMTEIYMQKKTSLLNDTHKDHAK